MKNCSTSFYYENYEIIEIQSIIQFLFIFKDSPHISFKVKCDSLYY